MKADIQVYPDLSFQGRLRSADELYQAEIAFFIEQIEEQGEAVFYTINYCQIEAEERNTRGQLTWLTVLLKTRGSWTRLFLEVRQPGTLVLYDRRRT